MCTPFFFGGGEEVFLCILENFHEGTRSIFYKKQRKIQTSHVSYFFEIFEGFCFLEIEKSWFFCFLKKESCSRVVSYFLQMFALIFEI